KGEQACFYVKPTRHPQLAFMIEDGRLSRVDIDSLGVPAQPGVQVGDSEALVLKAYGTRLTIESHKYLEEGHYLTVISKDGRFGLRFETDGKRVTSFYGGTREGIQCV